MVDYAIASVELMKYIGYFCVGDLTVNSDHCPLNITLSSNSTSQTNKIYINNLQGLLLMVRSLIPSLQTISSTINSYRFLLVVNGIFLWNKLPHSILDLGHSASAFKLALRRWLFL